MLICEGHSKSSRHAGPHDTAALRRFSELDVALDRYIIRPRRRGRNYFRSPVTCTQACTLQLSVAVYLSSCGLACMSTVSSVLLLTPHCVPWWYARRRTSLTLCRCTVAVNDLLGLTYRIRITIQDNTSSYIAPYSETSSRRSCWDDET